MPMTSVARLRLNNIVTCLNEAMETLEVIAKSLETPFLAPICTITRTLVTSVQNVKRNKYDCTQMLEQIYEMLYGIIRLHLVSNTGGEFPPSVLNYLGQFTETLHQVHTFVEAQLDKGRIRQFFRQDKMSTLRKCCTAGLEQALVVFKVQGINILSGVAEMQQYSQRTHEEVLELISSLSDGANSDGTSSTSRPTFLLPSEPKIFHGRESELSVIIKSFERETPRVAILGTGGMGKTSLSNVTRYGQHRFFVTCDTVLAVSPPSLLILDNLETIWDPIESRRDVENFLALLTEITMRGAQRPANVQWSHPFLEPLRPLRQDAARQTFIDIADEIHDLKDIDKILLLQITCPLPSILLHILTSMLSDGYDRKSNLDLSISLSLSSPRMTSSPHACDLLSLLAMLPDGLSNAELLQSKLPLENILACKSTLLGTSLAYMDDQKRLKALTPIREFMQQNHPPHQSSHPALLEYFRELLELYTKFVGTVSSPGIIARISSNFANIQNILLNGLIPGNPDCVKYPNRSWTNFLMERILHVLPQPNDPVLEVYFITEVLAGWERYLVPNAGYLIERAVGYMGQFSDPDLQCRFYNTLADYYGHKHQNSTAVHFSRTALSLAISTGNIRQQARALTALAMFAWRNGDYSEAQHSGESLCWLMFGGYAQSLSLSKRARELLRVCGMSGGQLDHNIMSNQAEVHLMKSEYVEARHIHTEILKAISIEQDSYQHALILLNIAQIDVQMNTPRHD
ncbi:hypothetical protein B0H13DRAFT_2016529, partial [Mycena leptocephala]